MKPSKARKAPYKPRQSPRTMHTVGTVSRIGDTVYFSGRLPPAKGPYRRASR